MLLRFIGEKAGPRSITSRPVFLFAIGVISALTFVAASLPGAQPASAQESNAEMKLVMTRGGTCEASTCTVALDGVFTLAVEIVQAPAEGYTGAQGFIDFGSDLVYNMTEDKADEVIWPDCAPEVTVRDQFTPATVTHGCLTGLIQPLPVSTYNGTFAELSITCSSAPTSTLIKLYPLGDDTDLGITHPDSGDPVTPGTSGAGFILEDLSQVAASVSGLTVACAAGVPAVPTLTQEPTATPGGPTNTPGPLSTPDGSSDTPSDSDSPRPTGDGDVPGDGSGDSGDSGDDGDDDGQTVLIVAIIIAVIVIGGGGAVFFVRRQRASASSDQE